MPLTLSAIYFVEFNFVSCFHTNTFMLCLLSSHDKAPMLCSWLCIFSGGTQFQVGPLAGNVNSDHSGKVRSASFSAANCYFSLCNEYVFYRKVLPAFIVQIRCFSSVSLFIHLFISLWTQRSQSLDKIPILSNGL